MKSPKAVAALLALVVVAVAGHIATVLGGTGVHPGAMVESLFVLTGGAGRPGVMDRLGLTAADPAVVGPLWAGLAAVGLGLLWGASRLWLLATGGTPSAGMSGAAELSRRVKGVAGGALTSVYARLNGKPIYARDEDTAAVLSPPRMGKTGRVAVWRVRDAPAACVATSTKPDLVRLTIEMRSKVGTVHVFDPEGVMNWPTPAKWDIVAGCTEDREAQERARAIVAARPLGGDSKNAGFFSEAAETVLRCLLHAAALEGRSMRDVISWTQDFRNDTPYNILDDNPAAIAGWGDDLRRFCRGEARETVSSTDMSLSLVLKAFAIEAILDSVCPKPGEGLNSEGFWSTTDTLYLLSESGEASLAAPVITALVASIEKAGRRAATRSRAGRLDPVMTLVLDEVANVAPIPTLPSLMSDGGGRGMPTWIFVQAPSQLRTRWGDDGAQTILNSASVTLVLGALKDTGFLEDVSRLIGDHSVERSSTTKSPQQSSTSTSSYMERVMNVSELRQLPEGDALLLYRELAPAKVQLPAWWESRDRKMFSASEKWALAQEGYSA